MIVKDQNVAAVTDMSGVRFTSAPLLRSCTCRPQVTHLPQQSHETRGRDHADLSCQGLSDGRPTLLLTAAIWVRLDRISST